MAKIEPQAGVSPCRHVVAAGNPAALQGLPDDLASLVVDLLRSSIDYCCQLEVCASPIRANISCVPAMVESRKVATHDVHTLGRRAL